MHLVTKGLSIHDEPKRAAMQSKQVAFIIIINQGSRPGPLLVPDAKVLIIDHHLSDKFPEGAIVVLVYYYLLVATSLLLIFKIYKILAKGIVYKYSYLRVSLHKGFSEQRANSFECSCIIRIHSNLSNSIK